MENSYCMHFFFMGVSTVYSMVAILHTETFVTFDYDPSLISGLKTDNDLD